MVHSLLNIVFGISGVGKSTACVEYIAMHPEFVHIRASDLFEDLQGKTFEDRPVNRAIDDQEILLRALQRRRQIDPTRSILLDAHSIVPSLCGYVPVPTKVIERIAPARLFFLEAAPNVIISRRRARAPEMDPGGPDEVRSLQNMARMVVETYSHDLSVPLAIIDANERAILP